MTSVGSNTIIGFGSLLSESSARTSFPNLSNFRLGSVKGYRRVYNHVGLIFIEKGLVGPESLELASLCAEETNDPSVEPMIVTVFEIPDEEIPAFHERERFFQIRQVPVEIMSEGSTITGLMCCRYKDDEELIEKRFNGREEYESKILKGAYSGAIYRSDILPCRVYLKHCFVAAGKLGDKVKENFVKHTLLADGQTTLEEYLNKNLGMLEKTEWSKTWDRYRG
eukprot:Nk52_evm12s2356 gene=Nk52_evmTU12s2356